jgi:hypothetical protein
MPPSPSAPSGSIYAPCHESCQNQMCLLHCVAAQVFMFKPCSTSQSVAQRAAAGNVPRESSRERWKALACSILGDGTSRPCGLRLGCDKETLPHLSCLTLCECLPERLETDNKPEQAQKRQKRQKPNLKAMWALGGWALNVS